MPRPLELGREVCGDERVASSREWLVTNGIGGFAAGTIGDILTRRNHGLLFAALEPPRGSTLLLAKLEASVRYGERMYALSANRWSGGTVAPDGYREIERFALSGSVPTWTYAFSDVLLDRAVWMEHGKNSTCIRFDVRRAGGALKVTLRALVNARDDRSLTRAYDVRDAVVVDGRSAQVQLNPEAPVLFISSDRGDMASANEWYRNFHLDAERALQRDDLEDHYHALTIEAELRAGESITIVAGTDARNEGAFPTLAERRERDERLLEIWRDAAPAAKGAPDWVERLVIAADQFIIESSGQARVRKTIVAGYPPFGDRERDAMIALPGLALVTGRIGVARSILSDFAFEAPEHHPVEAILWFFEAIRRYVDQTGDHQFVDDLLPALSAIVSRYRRGARDGVHVDDTDGLLHTAVALPRTGKAVEINALWYSALRSMQIFCAHDNGADTYEHLANRTQRSFERFWNDDAGYCFDVIDGPAGNDASIRPNAVIAASLVRSPLTLSQRRRVVERAARDLLTSYGLRTLAPDDPKYHGRCNGARCAGEEACDQGVVRPWLLGPFASAHLAVYGNAAGANALFATAQSLMQAYAAGTLPEFADGDAPFAPRGRASEASSVSEFLRAWHQTA